jgi:hypothetical protein
MLQAKRIQCVLPTTSLYSANTIGNGSRKLTLYHSSDGVLSWRDVSYPDEITGDGGVVEEKAGVEDKGKQDHGKNSKGNGQILKGGSHEGTKCLRMKIIKGKLLMGW